GWDPRVVAALREALGGGDPTLRQYALRSLAQLGETEALLDALADPAPAVRAFAAEALGWWGLGQAGELEALRRAGADPDPEVASAAAVALRRLGALPIRRPRPARRRSSGGTAEDPRFPWRPLLGRWSRQWLKFDEYAAELPDEVAESGWLGYPPASERQIAAAEARLGATLPPSYRAFLRVSNGWRRTSPFISRLWGAEE